MRGNPFGVIRICSFVFSSLIISRYLSVQNGYNFLVTFSFMVRNSVRE
ncbi:unnamed protein product [Acanthoscelides obtectus]|uniref:Uncharacterized protein n=1 Tax=Acanthoscelides obtectus TaxID=200917 RepID=A0A9P0PIV3_ACAOB|nr:unnamed protein product [Acanthoscelides obtectus]CAK1649286.1 hypothetical protein AOBTE_LOCUS16131 [Acanthoscelides obtectus]